MTLILQLYSQNHWLADGSTTIWNFNFAGGYISRSHVKAYSKSPLDVRTEIPVTDSMFVGEYQLSITPAVADGHTLVIYRDTPKDGPLVDFTTRISETALNVAHKQAVFVAAEMADYFGVTTSADLLNLATQAGASAAAAAASATNAGTASGVAEGHADDAAGFAAASASSASTASAAATSALTSLGTFSPIVAAIDGRMTAFEDQQDAERAISRYVVATGTTSDRANIQTAVNELHASGQGGDLVLIGDFQITGVASADGQLNGVVIPFGGFTVDNRIRIFGIGDTKLTAVTTNTILLRVSRPGTRVEHLAFDGASLADVWGIGLVPEDRTQTSTLVSQSFCRVHDVHIQGCEEGIVVEPGPTVTGSQSGAFYVVVTDSHLNLNTRSFWAKVSPHDATNRPTRGNISHCRIERGNCGVDLEYATEFTMAGNNFQFFNSSYTGPVATSSAIHIGALSENNYLYGGNSEACDYDINNEGTLPNALMIHGFALTGTNHNAGVLPLLDQARLQLTKRTAVNEQLVLGFVNSSFVRLVADWGATGTKDLSVETNGVRRMSWFNGITTHYGTTSNWTWNATGNQQLPSVDNVADIGSASFRLQRIYVNQIRFGDGTLVFQSGSGSPNGVVTAPPGSVYTSTAGGANITLYIKESGTGNTGWVAK